MRRTTANNSQGRSGWMLRFACAVSACLALLSAGVAQVNTSDHLSSKLLAMQSFSASFNQRVENEFGDVLEESTGVFHFDRPRALLWQTYAPFPVIVSTTDTDVRVYDQDLAQVTEMSLDEVLASTPASIILAADENMGEAFDVKEIFSPGQREYRWEYILTPKFDDAEFTRIRMLFDDVAFTALEIDDALSNHTSISFHDRRINEPLADEVFDVTYPDGVDWVRQ